MLAWFIHDVSFFFFNGTIDKILLINAEYMYDFKPLVLQVNMMNNVVATPNK